MEDHINDKVQQSMNQFKNDLKRFIINMNTKSDSVDINTQSHDGKIHEIEYFIDSYNIISILKEDLKKKTRIKNIVPQYARCIAKIQNMERCTRRKKYGTFCGTHQKNLPFGVIEDCTDSISSVEFKKISISAKDIQGIFYYIDANGNVYDTNDIMNSIKNPKIVATYEIINGEYHIPSFNL